MRDVNREVGSGEERNGDISFSCLVQLSSLGGGVPIEKKGRGLR
jgi:alpha-D-ribose 1-methylphosphonate 5-triphosphate synthase subunit PhnH